MSKRISRTMAHNAAEALAKQAFEEKYANAQKNLQAVIDEMYEKYIPKPVRSIGKEYKDTYLMTKHFKVTKTHEASAWDYKLYDTTEEHPEFDIIILSKEDYNKLANASTKMRNAKNDWDEYELDVETALFNLRTESKVKEFFPEALPHLNFSDTTAMTVNYSKLRDMLKK